MRDFDMCTSYPVKDCARYLERIITEDIVGKFAQRSAVLPYFPNIQFTPAQSILFLNMADTIRQFQ
jgi:hypothetical protein